MWKTPLVCKKSPTVECGIKVGSKQFDLSPLAMGHTNWRSKIQVKSGVDRKNEVYINVCRPLVQIEQVQKCKTSSGLCIVNGNK